MPRGRLPLTSLRSFESAGRKLSFTLAAEELFVTQAAISRQIRELERSLGTKLFARHHRRVSLTETGALLLARVSAGFDLIDDALRDVSSAAQANTLVVSAEPGFAACWLVGHLAAFREVRPDIDVEVLADERVIEFRASRAELAIRYSASAEAARWPRVEARRLVRSVATPVLSPSLLAAGPALREPADLAHYKLLHEDGRQFWGVWMEQAGVSPAMASRGPLYNASGLVAQAALEGHGVALGDLALLRDEIASGRLVTPFDLRVRFGGYWLVAPRFAALGPAARAFAAWLQSSIGDEAHREPTRAGQRGAPH